MHIIEQATQRLLDTLTDQISKKFNIETNEISSNEADKSQLKNKNTTRYEQRSEKNGNQTNDLTFTPSNGIKHKQISPTSLTEKQTDATTDSETSQNETTGIRSERK